MKYKKGSVEMNERKYLCIDLKSFYASVECVERGLDPLTTNLVVADDSRTEKTICLAVTPSLKSYGISGRARLFEVVQKIKEVNYERKYKLYGKEFDGESYDDIVLKNNKHLSVSYITAPPRMEYYSNYSAKIFGIYLKYVSEEDILSYSIDEVFMDITNYLSASKKTPYEFAMTIIQDVLSETGITATAGIGTNMYLAKIAMDIVAKKMPAGKDGVRIAELDEMSYRKELWQHEPLTDFWRIGKGTANINCFTSSARLIIKEALKLFDSIVNEKLLVRRVTASANNVTMENEVLNKPKFEQMELFVDYEAKDTEQKKEDRGVRFYDTILKI